MSPLANNFPSLRMFYSYCKIFWHLKKIGYLLAGYKKVKNYLPKRLAFPIHIVKIADMCRPPARTKWSLTKEMYRYRTHTYKYRGRKVKRFHDDINNLQANGLALIFIHQLPRTLNFVYICKRNETFQRSTLYKIVVINARSTYATVTMIIDGCRQVLHYDVVDFSQSSLNI